MLCRLGRSAQLSTCAHPIGQRRRERAAEPQRSKSKRHEDERRLARKAVRTVPSARSSKRAKAWLMRSASPRSAHSLCIARSARSAALRTCAERRGYARLQRTHSTRSHRPPAPGTHGRCGALVTCCQRWAMGRWAEQCAAGASAGSPPVPLRSYLAHAPGPNLAQGHLMAQACVRGDLAGVTSPPQDPKGGWPARVACAA